MENNAATILIHESRANGLPVTMGCPFPSNVIPPHTTMGFVKFASGKTRPLQCKPLTPPTPGGLRWMELSFLANEKGPAEVVLGNNRPEWHERSASAAYTLNGVVLNNGLIRATLGCAQGSPHIRIETRSAIKGTIWQTVGCLSPEVVGSEGMLHRDDAALERHARILHVGPLRAQAELHGRLQGLNGRPSLHYRLTVELWQDIRAMRIDWMLAHRIPNQPAFETQRATLTGNWRLGANAERRFIQNSHTPYYRQREVHNPAPVTIVSDFTCAQTHVSDPAMLLDASEYPFYLHAPTIATGDWLAVCGKDASVFACVADFSNTPPNALESHAETLHYHFIPSGHTTAWLQGRRKEQTLLLSFAGGVPAPETTSEALAQMRAIHSFGRALPSKETLIRRKAFDMEVVLPGSDGRNIRLNTFMSHLCRLDTPADKWDIGDTRDYHYTSGYAGTPNNLEWRKGAPAMPLRYRAAGHIIWPLAMTEFLEPVWTNNEYDIIHAIAVETMRTAQPAHMQMLRWAARHTIETDFAAFSDDQWHNRATPFHSLHHNKKGVITSHLWTQGLLQYHALTADRDALEVALALGEKIVEINKSAEARQWKFDRELGWAMLSLVCLVEAGHTQFQTEADRIARFLQEYDRAGFTGAVNLSRGCAGRSLERQMVDNGFGYSSMIEAMARYQRLPGRGNTEKWLIPLLRQLHDEIWNAVRECEMPGLLGMAPLVMAYGYEYTGNKEFLNTGMVITENFFDSNALEGVGYCSRFMGQSKPMAMAHRALARFLGHADRLGLLDALEFSGVLAGIKTRTAALKTGKVVKKNPKKSNK